MDPWAIIASSAFGLSALVSAAQLGKWALRADPRTLARVGQWSLLALCVLAAAVLVWLIANGRWTQAMLPAAFVMPVLVEGASRWHGMLSLLRGWRGFRAKGSATLDDGHPAGGGDAIDPEMVRQSVAVLTAYLEQTKRALEHRPADARLGNGSGRAHMAIGEALAVLGLEAGAHPDQICEAHHLLRQRLDPELGGMRHLAMQIDEARDVLLGM
jgi:hypothetical protein